MYHTRYTTATLHGSALSLSIRNHDETAKALRHAGATHGSKGSHASSADLIDAASKGDLDAVMRLVEEQNIPIDVGDYDSRTPLHLAAGEGRQVLLSTLVPYMPHRVREGRHRGAVQRANRSVRVPLLGIPCDSLTCATTNYY